MLLQDINLLTWSLKEVIPMFPSIFAASQYLPVRLIYDLLPT
jgi:hypothetical protein